MSTADLVVNADLAVDLRDDLVPTAAHLSNACQLWSDLVQVQ